MRSSCETVETKSDFICSTAHSDEMSRKAKIRPATAPAGSRITASESESQSSSPPRVIETRRFVPPDSGLEVALEDLGGRAPERLVGRNAGDPLGGRVPDDDAPVAVDGDDPVGDVRQDGGALLVLERDSLVELGVRERDRRVRGERGERLDLLLSPGSGLGARRPSARRGAPPPASRAGHRDRPGSRARARRPPRRAQDRRRRLRARPARAAARRRRRAMPVEGDSAPIACSTPSPTAAEMTSRSSSSVARAPASASSSAIACSTTSSTTAAGSSAVASRLPVRASCWESERPVRSASKRRLRSSAPRAARASWRASSRSSLENVRGSRVKTSTSPCPVPSTGIASSEANGASRHGASRRSSSAARGSAIICPSAAASTRDGGSSSARISSGNS